MEILHNLWNVVSTEDENLVKYMLIILGFIEIYVTIRLASVILDINYNKKQRITYQIIMGVLYTTSILFIPKQISLFVHLIMTPIIIKYVFKVSLIKSILAVILPMIIITFFETIYVKLCLILFGISITNCANIIIYRIPYMLFTYSTIFLVSKIVKYTKINLNSFESLSKTQKRLLVINLILIGICFCFQFYLLIFYSSVLNTLPLFLSLVFLLTYTVVSIYSIIKTINFEQTKKNLEQSELHNKTLELLYNNIRAFKHDFSNIITAFGGYIYAKDLNGLKKYYEKILDECHINNNLSTLNPEVINNAAIYNILATKYYKADEAGIDIDLQVFINLNNLKMDIYDFSRILGILMDNAIEAASECEKKTIKIDIRDIKPRKCQILTIQNTYSNHDIDLNKITEKGYTSKIKDKENHGIGLWQVAKIIKKHKNVLLDTTKDGEFFKQDLAIYYK